MYAQKVKEQEKAYNKQVHELTWPVLVMLWYMLFDIFALSFTTAKATQGSQGFWFIQETSGEMFINCTLIGFKHYIRCFKQDNVNWIALSSNSNRCPTVAIKCRHNDRCECSHNTTGKKTWKNYNLKMFSSLFFQFKAWKCFQVFFSSGVMAAFASIIMSLSSKFRVLNSFDKSKWTASVAYRTSSNCG